MSDFSGRLVSYGLALETARGTAVAPQFWIRWETADFADTATNMLNASALNVLDKYSGSEVTETWSTGQIAGKVTDHAFGLILYAAFGGYSVGTHAGETKVYDHTYTEAQTNACPTLTITRHDPNVDHQFTKAMLNQLDVDVKAGDFVRHTSSFVANPNVTPSAQTPAYVTEQEFIAKHVSVTFNGGASIPLASFKLTVNKNVSPYWILGQTNPGDIFATAVEIKGEMVLRWTDQTYYTARFGNTVENVVVTIQNSGVTIGNSTNPTITFTMPQSYLTSWKPDQALDGIVQQTVDFEATYSLSSGKAISATLVNTHTSYSPAGVS